MEQRCRVSIRVEGLIQVELVCYARIIIACRAVSISRSALSKGNGLAYH